MGRARTCLELKADGFEVARRYEAWDLAASSEKVEVFRRSEKEVGHSDATVSGSGRPFEGSR